MFRRISVALPKDPKYPTDLDGLGFVLDGHGRFVDKITGQFFPLFKSDNERNNEVYTDASHTAVRKVVEHELASRYNVKKLFITGREGKDVEAIKRANKDPHVTILCTDRRALAKKSDVVVIIPDRNQELGIWSWRELLSFGGIQRGSVAGLVKKLQGLNLHGVKVNIPDVSREHSLTTCNLQKNEQGESVMSDSESVTFTELAEVDIPGIIILNPGQLVFSNFENKNMSERSWIAAPRKHALAAPKQIHAVHNRITGHTKPEEHINTVLTHILPELLPKAARVWLISVGDGTENLIKYMGGRMSEEKGRKMVIANRVTRAMAFMQPTYDPEEVSEEPQEGPVKARMLKARFVQVKPELAKQKISTRGKSWVLSYKPFGTTLVLPPPVAEDPFEDVLISDPIDIKYSRASMPDPLDLPVVGRPNFRFPHGYADYERHRSRALTVPDVLGKGRGSGGYVPPRPSNIYVPPLNPFTTRSPSEGSPDDGPKDEADAEEERKQKEFALQAARSTSPSSPSFLNQHANMSGFLSVFDRALADSMSGTTAAESGNDRRIWDETTKTFRLAQYVQDTVSEDGEDPVVRDFAYETQFPKVGRFGSSSHPSGQSSPSTVDSCAVYSDSDSGDLEMKAKVPGGYLSSTKESTDAAEGFGLEQEESARMRGGDFDDDDGLWMKPYRSGPSRAGEEDLVGSEDAGPGDSGVLLPESEAKSSERVSPDPSDSGSPVPELSPDISGDGASSGPGVGAGAFPADSDSISETGEVSAGGEGGELAAPGQITDLGWHQFSGALEQTGADTASDSEEDAEPAAGDMLRVSGAADDLEMLWCNAEDDVLAWFVEMAQK